MKFHKEGIFEIDISPDGSMLACSSDDRTVSLWDLNTRKMIGEPLKGHRSGVLCV